MDDFRNNFLRDYITPSHPIAYSGINTIYNYYNAEVPKRTIEEYLSLVKHYSLHKETHRRYTNPFYVYKKRKQIQADLIELGKLTKKNPNTRYLLAVIDVFTRKAWIRPLRNKTAKIVVDNFKSILEEMEKDPEQLLTDSGIFF